MQSERVGWLPKRTPARTLRATFLVAAILAARVTAAGGPGTQPATAPAANPTPAQAAEIERLVGLLSRPEWRVRDKAEAELAALGDVAERRLVHLTKSTDDAEVRARAHSALERIASMRKLGPTRVTLRVKDATPQEVFAELARQGGVPIEAYRASLWRQRDWPRVTLDRAGEPFWAAVRAACTQSGLRPLYEGGEPHHGTAGRVVLLPDVVGDMEAPAAFSASFMVLVNSLAKAPRLGEENDADARERLELQLTFYADPKWRIVTYPDEAPLDAVTDEKGGALPRPAPMRLQAYKPGSPIWQMRTALEGVPRGAARLGGLKGSFRIVLLGQSEPMEVSDLMAARNVTRRAGRQSLTVQEVTPENDGQSFRVKLLLSRNGLSQQGWRQQRETDGIRVLDANGRDMMRSASEVRETGDQVLYNFQYVAAPVDAPVPPGAPPAGKAAPPGVAPGVPAGVSAPAKLVCRIPLEPREVTVPFEFGPIPVGR